MLGIQRNSTLGFERYSCSNNNIQKVGLCGKVIQILTQIYKCDVKRTNEHHPYKNSVKLPSQGKAPFRFRRLWITNWDTTATAVAVAAAVTQREYWTNKCGAYILIHFRDVFYDFNGITHIIIFTFLTLQYKNEEKNIANGRTKKIYCFFNAFTEHKRIEVSTKQWLWHGRPRISVRNVLCCFFS